MRGLVGRRFANSRRDTRLSSMLDDAELIRDDLRTHVVLAEAKRGLIDINPTLSDASNGNIYRVLRAIGALADDQSKRAAAALHASGEYLSDHLRINLLAFGNRPNDQLNAALPLAIQIVWANAFDFIFRRFRDYPREKQSHGQWDEQGKLLWELAFGSESASGFEVAIKQVW